MPIWRNPKAFNTAAENTSTGDQDVLNLDGGAIFDEKDVISSAEARRLDLLRLIRELEQHDRTSFSSVKEDRDAAISQSFKETKLSSYSKDGNEEAVEDSQDGM